MLGYSWQKVHCLNPSNSKNSLLQVSCLYDYAPAGSGKLRPSCLLTCSGISLLISSGEAPAT
uniref:Shaggy-related protein kinase zeta n=1 Tax=Rhizophora mucronata TaxID=61149 RepID=A0A2P2K4H7_RHIMU